MPDRTAHTLAAALESEQRGDSEHALSIFDAAIADGLRDVLILSNRGLLLERMGKVEQALEAFLEAAAVESNFRDHYNAGNMLLALQRFDEAIPQYVDSLRCRDDYPECWVNKGIAHHQLGQAGAARKSFERALEFAPDFYPALRGLAVLIASQGDEAESLRYFEQAAKARPDDPEAWFEYACLLYKQLGEGPVSFEPRGPEGLATQALDRVVELDPQRNGAWGRKIGVLFRLVDAAQASDNARQESQAPSLFPLIYSDLVQTIEAASSQFPDDPWFSERMKDATSMIEQ